MQSILFDQLQEKVITSKMPGKFILKLCQVFCFIHFLSNVSAKNISEWREYMKGTVLRMGIIQVSYVTF